MTSSTSRSPTQAQRLASGSDQVYLRRPLAARYCESKAPASGKITRPSSPEIMAATTAGFLQYHEPDIISLLTLISFFFFLSSVGWVFNKAIRAGLIGQILIGIVYGTPVGDILATAWQETFMALGYVGLILIIFEGGLTIRLDLLKANFILSIIAAAIGITAPIALCYLLLYLGFKYGALETFIIGAALSTTSIGTTFVVISSSARVDFTHTKVGTVLISAALFDDVVGLIMVSVISNLGDIGEGGGGNIGWIVGRPILASFAIAAVSPLMAKFAAGPLYRRFAERHVASLGHRATICTMTLVLSAHLVVCAYAGASLLFGAFLAGTFLSTLPEKLPEAIQSEDVGSVDAPAFHKTFETFISGPQAFILEPLFFASIGFAIPFKRLWTGTVVWRGIVLSLLMTIGKVGISRLSLMLCRQVHSTEAKGYCRLSLVSPSHCGIMSIRDLQFHGARSSQATGLQQHCWEWQWWPGARLGC